MGNSRLLNVCRVMFLLILFLTGLAVATEFYLPPSIYRTLSTRHRSLFPQPAFKDIKITAHVAHKDSLQQVDVTLHYGSAIGDYNSLPMSKNEHNVWQAVIPAVDVNSAAIYYYLKVDDGVNVRTAPPGNYGDNPFKLDIDFAFDENAPPHIELMPRTAKLDSLILCKNENILVSAYVVDNSEPLVKNVWLHFQIDEIQNDISDNMEARSDYLWDILIPKEVLSNSMQMRILAIDPVLSDTTVWPPLDSSRFTMNTSSRTCPVVPPFIRLAEETKMLTWEEGGADLPFQTPVEIKVLTTSTTPLDSSAVAVYYQPSFMTDFVKANFAKTSIDSVWKVTIPAAAVADPFIKFFVEVVQGKDEVTAPIWKARLRYFNLPIKAPNLPPRIRRTEQTREMDESARQAGRPIAIEAYITDTLGPDVATAALYYRQRGEPAFTEVLMQPVVDSLWRAEIPAEKVQIGFLEYFLQASDGEEVMTDPDRQQSPDSVYVIEIKNLNAPPVITLTPATAALSHSPQPARIEIVIEAFIVDTLGPDVQSAILLYRHDNNDYSPRTMNHVADSTWRAVLPANTVLPDTLYYYISATDGDSTGHSPKPPPAPWEQPHKIAVIMNNDLPVIIHTPPVSATVDSTINISAQVIDSTLAVEFVELRYRNVKCDFKSLRMTFDQNQYIAAIPGADVIEPFVKYYIFAKGSYSPDDTTQSPVYTVPIIKPHIVRPNPFTPNNDGYNDMVTFNFEGLNSGGEVVIYNRRGRMVRRLYSGEPWDGRDDAGAELPPDVYLYAVTIDGELQRSGTLTLIR